MFAQVISDFNDRVREVNLYFQVLSALDNDELAVVAGTGPQVVPIGATPTDWGRMLKGTAYLILYNLVEAFVRRGFNEVFLSIQADGLKAVELTESLRTQWIAQKNKRISAFDGSPKIYMRIAYDIVTEVMNGSVAQLHKDHLPFSGNLDADVIREVCSLHGVPYATPPAARGGTELANVRRRRNDLAHGNESFVECGRNLTASDLVRVKGEVVAFMTGILQNLEQFDLKKTYKV